MLYMYEVLSPLSLCAKFTLAQLLHSRMLIYIYIFCSIEWHGGQVVRRRSRNQECSVLSGYAVGGLVSLRSSTCRGSVHLNNFAL